jgi:hypothetical protein
MEYYLVLRTVMRAQGASGMWLGIFVSDKTGDGARICRYHSAFCVQGKRAIGERSLENP